MHGCLAIVRVCGFIKEEIRKEYAELTARLKNDAATYTVKLDGSQEYDTRKLYTVLDDGKGLENMNEFTSEDDIANEYEYTNSGKCQFERSQITRNPISMTFF